MFSVLMSCYKNDDPFEFLAAVNSMFDQSYRPAEFILICDGPLNIELESQILIAIEISNKKGITFVVHRLPSNVGLGQALSLGLSRCTQEFIVRMDSDDLSRSNRLMLMKNEIIRNKQLDVIGGQIEEFKEIPGDTKRKRVVPLDHKGILKRSRIRSPMNHVTVCIRTEKLRASGSYEHMLWHEDYFLWLKLLNAGCMFANIPEVTVDVRVKDLSNRRSGIAYAKSELQFAKEAYSRGYLSIPSAILFVILRSSIRVLPKTIINLVYTALRSK